MTKTRLDSACAYATLIDHITPGPSARVFGLDATERLRRSFGNSGLEVIDVDDVATLGSERIVALDTNHFYDEIGRAHV